MNDSGIKPAKRRKVSINTYELYVPGWDGTLELVQWAFNPRHGRVPDWYRGYLGGHRWHLVDPTASLVSQEFWEHRLESFSRVGDAAAYVGELVEWAKAAKEDQ